MENEPVEKKIAGRIRFQNKHKSKGLSRILLNKRLSYIGFIIS